LAHQLLDKPVMFPSLGLAQAAAAPRNDSVPACCQKARLRPERFVYFC
jgi:hypothetical protein